MKAIVYLVAVIVTIAARILGRRVLRLALPVILSQRQRRPPLLGDGDK